jgi:hypothetical protein
MKAMNKANSKYLQKKLISGIVLFFLLAFLALVAHVIEVIILNCFYSLMG